MLLFVVPSAILPFVSSNMADDRGIQASKLQVLIVGGSLGGLATAIALKSQGHFVKVGAIPESTEMC